MGTGRGAARSELAAEPVLRLDGGGPAQSSRNSHPPPHLHFLVLVPPPGAAPPSCVWVPPPPLHGIPHERWPCERPLAAWYPDSMAGTREASAGLGIGSASHAARGDGATCRTTTNEPRKRGGQPGNQNALKHGLRTREAERNRKVGHAGIKVLQHLLISQGMIPRAEGRLRPRPVRQDQMALLIEAEPELAALVRAAGGYLPDLSTGRRMAATCEDICDAKDCALVNIVV